MTLILAYTPREMDAAEECEALGLTAYVPRRVDMKRQGNRRRPDAVISAAWPRYAFIEATAEHWHWLRDCPSIRDIQWVPEREAALIRRQAEAIEAEFAKRMAQIEAGDRVSEYEPGNLLEIVSGEFAGQVVTFTRMIERANELFPRIRAEMELFGRVVSVEVDPLHVRAAE